MASLTRPNTPMPSGGAVRRPPPGPYRAPGPETSAPSLDEVAQGHGYPDFAAWQAAEPELAQLIYNAQPSGDPSQATYQKPGPRGWDAFPLKEMLIMYGPELVAAMLDVPWTPEMAGATDVSSFVSAASAGTGLLAAAPRPDVSTYVSPGSAMSGGGAAALSQLSRSGQPPPLRNSPQDQALRGQQPANPEHPDDPTFHGGPYTPPPTDLPNLPPVVPMPYSPTPTNQPTDLPNLPPVAPNPNPTNPPPPPPPKPKTLLDKVLPLLGLPLDYLASRQSQNATAAATQQLVQAGQQAKADLSKVYGGVTPVLSQVVQRQQANLAPYTSLGSGAASLLGYGLGIPGVQAAPSGVYAPPVDPFGTYNQIIAGGTPPPAGSVLKSSFQQGESPFQPAGPGQTGGTPFPTSPPSQTADTTAPPATAPLSSLDPRTQTQSSYMVTMRAPTGDTEQVPASQVAWYQSKGAQVVA